MPGIRHGHRTTKNCVPIRVLRLKNYVYIVAPTHVETCVLWACKKSRKSVVLMYERILTNQRRREIKFPTVERRKRRCLEKHWNIWE